VFDLFAFNNHFKFRDARQDNMMSSEEATDGPADDTAADEEEANSEKDEL
jgi:hypothetical protein